MPLSYLEALETQQELNFSYSLKKHLEKFHVLPVYKRGLGKA